MTISNKSVYCLAVNMCI